MTGFARMHVPKTAAIVSLLLGLLAAVAVVGFNEMGYRRSAGAVHQMSAYDRARGALYGLMQSLLDAETGQRGFLLTRDARYLEPYQKSIENIHEQLDSTRALFSRTNEETADFKTLGERIERKLVEMETTVRLGRSGSDDAWKFIIGTDVGNDLMSEIRAQIARLIERSTDEIEQRRLAIVQSLKVARAGIALTSVIALLAFYQTLRQARALAIANEQRKQELERERDLLDKLVRKRTARLAELATYLQKVREDERAHLARELHDELGSLLTAAKLDVARLKSKISGAYPDLQQRLTHLTETLNSGIALKRRIIEDLRPSSLANLGLAASLDILTREFATQSEIRLATEIEEVALDDATQLTVYRLVQESLTNIAKYARARNVSVIVRDLGEQIEVVVRDDGSGFDTENVRRNAHGLAGMRHRVEAAGGQLRIESSAGSGTRIAALLPKSAQPAAEVAVTDNVRL